MAHQPSLMPPPAPKTTSLHHAWSSLHADLVRLLGWQVLAGDILDYVRFRVVCAHSRSSTIAPRSHGIVDPRFHPKRWFLLPEGHGLQPADVKKRFFNLCTGVFVRAWLPFLSDSYVLDSANGLLLLQRKSQDTSAIRVLHPFTGDFVELPPLMSLVRANLDMSDGTGRVDFRSVTSISVTVDGFVAVMIKLYNISRVFFATTKDQHWSVSTWNIGWYSETISSQGKLFVLDSPTTHHREQHILQIDPPRLDHHAMSSYLLPPRLIATCPTNKISAMFYMEECVSEILVIGHDANPLFKGRMLVYKVADLIMGKVVPVTSIEGNTLFTTIDHGISIDDDDISVYVRETIAVSYKVIPTAVGDTIVRRRHLKDNSPLYYDLSSGEWSQGPAMGVC
ncbi:unnamed protein product [Triticum aestivum]|uniref:KIB1-4 beta-propeller domain-containing protein n=1 Tax=Triticum aestivum TaxID=4565 RepID=A0A7H4LR90_WHEAT|nr:unnamed protein product [Triticum aestivum]